MVTPPAAGPAREEDATSCRDSEALTLILPTSPFRLGLHVVGCATVDGCSLLIHRKVYACLRVHEVKVVCCPSLLHGDIYIPSAVWDADIPEHQAEALWKPRDLAGELCDARAGLHTPMADAVVMCADVPEHQGEQGDQLLGGGG